MPSPDMVGREKACYGQDDGYADSDIWCIVAFGDVSVVIRGPSSGSDPSPVGEGYRIGKNMGGV